MKNLIYYNKNKCDVYSKKMYNRYEKLSVDKFDIKNSILTLDVNNFLIKPIYTPLDNSINDRVLNSLKFHYNNFNDVLYDYFLLDSNIKYGQVRILLYAMKLQKEIEDIFEGVDKSYLVVRPIQFLLVEFFINKLSTNEGIILNKLEDGRYNVIIYKDNLILFNDYIDKRVLNRLDAYLEVKLDKLKNEFDVSVCKKIYFLNDNESKSRNLYGFEYEYLNYSMEEILTNRDLKGKFSKFWKRKETFRKHA